MESRKGSEVTGVVLWEGTVLSQTVGPVGIVIFPSCPATTGVLPTMGHTVTHAWTFSLPNCSRSKFLAFVFVFFWFWV